jgi:predicted phage-related endonuclease
MKDTTLTPDQVEARYQGIGGSQAKMIMDGNWLELWEEKTKRRPPLDLTDVFKVQLGINTEAFNLAWLEKTTGWTLHYPTNPAPTWRHIIHKFMLCHPDALATVNDIPSVIDAKHLSPMAPWNTEEDALKRYYWQGQHNMIVLDRPQFYLSCIWGNEFGTPLLLKANGDHQALLIEREKAFWWHVENDKAPNEVAAVETPNIAIDNMKTVDMKGNNQWASEAVNFIANEKAAKTFETAKKTLKGLVEPDVRHAFGHGIEGTRAKNGNLTIRKIKEK